MKRVPNGKSSKALSISSTRKPIPFNGIRDPERTRRNLLDAAYREFSTSGYHGASIDKISKRAGASKQMLFHHFGSKENMYLTVLERAYEAARAHDLELDVDGMEPKAAMRMLVGASFDYLRDHRDFVSLLADENINKGKHIKRSKKLGSIYVPLIAKIARTLKRGEEQGIFRSGIDPYQLYISISALRFFYFSNAYTLEAALDIELMTNKALKQRRDHIMDFVMSSLAAHR